VRLVDISWPLSIFGGDLLGLHFITARCLLWTMALYAQHGRMTMAHRTEASSMEMIATKVYLPKPLKRRAFAAFAMADTNFSRWTRECLERWLNEKGIADPQPLQYEMGTPLDQARRGAN
jgi:hypothetical protein